MPTIVVKDSKIIDIQKVLTSCVTPRPIAMASTIDKEGNINLAPFSFYNSFGANPAILVFSPALRGRDGASKNTLENLKEVPEVVINAVSYQMVEQVNIAGMEYPKGINEFIKAGFETIESESVRPPRIKISPVQFECKVSEIIQTGEHGGAGNLVICHIQRIHLSDEILDSNGQIDETKLDLVGRMGADHYVRAIDGMFVVKKPGTKLGIGIDALPDFIRNSHFLSGNELGKMGSLDVLPIITDDDMLLITKELIEMKITSEEQFFTLSKKWLSDERVADALKLLLIFKQGL